MDGDARAIFDLEAFGRQTGGDASLGAEIIQMFLEDCPVVVADIRAAVTQGDAAALASSAHSLKGSASYMAASIVRGHAAELEHMGQQKALDAAPAVLDELDAAVAALIAELHKIKG